MKIARVETSDGEIATVSPVGGGWIRCTGDLRRGWTLTETSVAPVRFLPPISPSVVFAIGLNYREHASEMRKPEPTHPVVAMKNPSSVIGHGDLIRLPRFLPSDSVDFEVELAVVIGKTCRNLRPENALGAVAGYTVANDVSARDWQNLYSGGQWCKGKGFDTFCPLGPVLVTADEIPDPNNLDLRLSLNGEFMQSSNTRDMIFGVRDLVAFLSGSTTLVPGTVILTGTPPGVGAARDPVRYLRAGDKLSLKIESIGVLENGVEDEPL